MRVIQITAVAIKAIMVSKLAILLCNPSKLESAGLIFELKIQPVAVNAKIIKVKMRVGVRSIFSKDCSNCKSNFGRKTT